MAAGKFSACLADLHRETEEPQVRGHPGDQCGGLSHSLDTVLGPGKHSPVSRAGLSLGASLNEPWGSYWGGGERDCFAPPPPKHRHGSQPAALLARLCQRLSRGPETLAVPPLMGAYESKVCSAEKVV